MAKIWSEENRLQKWLEIEILVCEALSVAGIIPQQAAKRIREKARVDPQRVKQIEERTRHDVAAFVEHLGEMVGEDARYIHWGLTSSDLLDTTLALLLREAAEEILQGIDELREVIKEKAIRYRHTPMIGRTHGIHAEPITLGLKFLSWYEELGRARRRVERAKEGISYGKISGAVGTYAHLDPKIEQYVCDKLGLQPERVSTQIVPRDRHGEYFGALAILATSMERFALEIRHLQRTEVGEVQEPFGAGQKGSSAMPHKKNPVLSENLCGLARLVRSYAQAAWENIPLWHERDISHSSVERVIGPDATIVVDFMLHRLRGVVEGLVVNETKMEENLKLTRGLIFSERVMLELMGKGMIREEAYRTVQELALRAQKEGVDFPQLVAGDRKVKALLSPEEIERCFSLEDHLRHVDAIFERVLG